MFQLCRGGQFYWWRKPENPEKTTDLPQVIKHINEDIKETKVYSMRLYSEEYSVDSNIYTFFSRIVCGRRVRVEHAVPYDEHRKDKSSKRRKPNYR